MLSTTTNYKIRADDTDGGSFTITGDPTDEALPIGLCAGVESDTGKQWFSAEDATQIAFKLLEAVARVGEEKA